MSNYEATKYDFDGANLTGIEGTATGTILEWSTASAPTGFLECAGAAVSRSTYSTLFGVIGTTYGVGDGSSTFNLPNLQDNVAMGKSGTKAIASTGGANTVAAAGTVGGSTGSHTLTTPEIAAHTHPAGGQYKPSGGGPPVVANGFQPTSTGTTGGGGGHSHNMSATFSGTATSVLQPYLTVMYIIKT
jgi:microcystin-dependent protein